MGRIHLGTSGYAYRHWKGILYPEGLPTSQWLAQYASVFATVELNATFYRLPSVRAVERWRDGTPTGFRFAVKGSRFLTHMKRLSDTGPGLDHFFERVDALGRKLSVVLWQLPPNMRHPDLDRLERFCRALPRTVRHAFEFRSAEWYTDEVAHLLDRHGAAFCEHDFVDAPIPFPTAGFRYLRFHGKTAGSAYGGRYGKRRLELVAHDLDHWQAGGHDAFVYFNNDLGGAAVSDALDLSEALGAGLPFVLEEGPSAER